MILHQRAHGKWSNSSEQRREWIQKFKRIQESKKQLKMVVNESDVDRHELER